MRDWALWLDVGQSVLLNASFYYAWCHRLLPMAVLNAGALVCNLWYLDKMAALYDDAMAAYQRRSHAGIVEICNPIMAMG